MKKISLKKVLLFTKNNYIINRSIPLILFIVALIAGSIIGALPVSDIETTYSWRLTVDYEAYESYKYSIDRVYEDLLGFDGAFSIVFFVGVFGIAFLSVLALNSFMREKSGNDFYHSLSLNRGELFVSNLLTAFVNSALTLIISQFAGLLFMNLLAGYKPMTLWEMILEQAPVILALILFLLFFCVIAMIATIGAGTVFAGIINYLSINFLLPGTILAVSFSGNYLFNSNLLDYLNHFPWPYAYTSPFIRYIFLSMGVYKMSVLSYILFFVASILLAVLGIYLYSRKKNENATKPLPFKKSVRPLQYILIFDAILFCSTFFKLITDSLIWCLIGGALALFFGFIIFNAFADKSFNAVFKGARHIAFIALMTIVLVIIFVADIFHIYKEPLPDTDKIEYSYIHVSVNYSDREEYVSYTFDKNTDDYYYKNEVIEITSDNADDLKNLYNFLAEYGPTGDKIVENKVHVTVSMGIECEGDLGNYHKYIYLTENSKNYDEVMEILEDFKEKYPPAHQNVYYYEVTEETEKTDPELID